MIKRFFLYLMGFIGLSLLSVAFGDNGPKIAMAQVRINVHDSAAIKRGAKYFVQYCMACHTMKYFTHNKVARNAGITLDKMPLKKKDWWFGAVPPDLTLVARRYSPEWIYTYLHVFYSDASRPTKTNNLLKPDTSMPNQLAPIQGEQVLTPRGKQLLKASQHAWRKPSYFSVLEMVKRGSMTPEEFDASMRDLVTFLTYAGDPGRHERNLIGVGVIIFLIIFFIIARALKKSYWKDVSKKN